MKKKKELFKIAFVDHNWIRIGILFEMVEKHEYPNVLFSFFFSFLFKNGFYVFQLFCEGEGGAGGVEIEGFTHHNSDSFFSKNKNKKQKNKKNKNSLE